MMLKLALIAVTTFVAVDAAEDGATMASCFLKSAKVNAACCGSKTCSGGVPQKCPSKACASIYMPFYRDCGMVLQAIEHQYPDSAQFSTLYESCVFKAGRKDLATGRIEDTSVKAFPLYNFNTMSSEDLRNWHLTKDSVMGGRSAGRFEKMNNAKCHGAFLSGYIELKHGGFINVRSPYPGRSGSIPRQSLAHADGIRICSKATVDYGVKDGKGDLYKINLRDGTRNTHTADFHTTEAGAPDFDRDDNCDGVISTLPFSAFVPSHWGRVTGSKGSINPAKIQQIGMDVSFVHANGKQNEELDHKACSDHDSSTACKNKNPFALCVQWIQYYKDAKHDDSLDEKISVYIINAQDQCGESTFPKKWTTAALKWVGGQGLNAKVGTCREAGYSHSAGSKTLDNTGAPSSVTVNLYTKPPTTTIYVINSQGQCGESTYPKRWNRITSYWMRRNRLQMRTGTCKQHGYTTPAGSKILRHTGHRGYNNGRDLVVKLYTKPSYNNGWGDGQH